MNTRVTIGLLTVVILILVLSKTYSLQNQITLLHGEMLSRPVLTSTQVLEIIKQNEQLKEREKATRSLTVIREKYKLASETTKANRRLYGNETALFTLQMFYDVECPFCRNEFIELKRIVDHSKGMINWELKHFPLGRHNPIAAIEAQAIECAAEIYNNRIAWVVADRLNTLTNGNGKGIGDIPNFVRTLGLNGSRIRNCLASDDHKSSINDDYQYGKSLGITGTPAVLIINNKSKRTHLVKSFKNSEQLLQVIQTKLMH